MVKEKLSLTIQIHLVKIWKSFAIKFCSRIIALLILIEVGVIDSSINRCKSVTCVVGKASAGLPNGIDLVVTCEVENVSLIVS